jgi:hypothetical protein
MATRITLPVRSDLEAYSFVANLDGTNYLLAFRFNSRSALWAMDISTAAGTPILSGIPVQTNVALTERFRWNPAMPPGSFIPIDTSGNNGDAGRDDLGNNVVLLYQEANS